MTSFHQSDIIHTTGYSHWNFGKIPGYVQNFMPYIHMYFTAFHRKRMLIGNSFLIYDRFNLDLADGGNNAWFYDFVTRDWIEVGQIRLFFVQTWPTSLLRDDWDYILKWKALILFALEACDSSNLSQLWFGIMWVKSRKVFAEKWQNRKNIFSWKAKNVLQKC